MQTIKKGRAFSEAYLETPVKEEAMCRKEG